jgi:ABC-type branched-subunit amino acid transport system substrate-binding protein
VILLACSPARFGALAGRLGEAGVKAAVLYGGPDVAPRTLQARLPTTLSVYLATAYTPEGLTPLGRVFAQHYEEKYHEPPELVAAQAYDGVRLLIELLEKAQSLAPTRIREEIGKMENFETVTGPVTWPERRTVRPVFLVRIKDREIKAIPRTANEGK